MHVCMPNECIHACTRNAFVQMFYPNVWLYLFDGLAEKFETHSWKGLHVFASFPTSPSVP